MLCVGRPRFLLRIEGLFSKPFPQCSLDATGFRNFVISSSLDGFPPQVNAEMSGFIHEGELGDVFGATLGTIVDNPGLVVPVVVGMENV